MNLFAASCMKDEFSSAEGKEKSPNAGGSTPTGVKRAASPTDNDAEQPFKKPKTGEGDPEGRNKEPEDQQPSTEPTATNANGAATNKAQLTQSNQPPATTHTPTHGVPPSTPVNQPVGGGMGMPGQYPGSAGQYPAHMQPHMMTYPPPYPGGPPPVGMMQSQQYHPSMMQMQAYPSYPGYPYQGHPSAAQGMHHGHAGAHAPMTPQQHHQQPQSRQDGTQPSQGEQSETGYGQQQQPNPNADPNNPASSPKNATPSGAGNENSSKPPQQQQQQQQIPPYPGMPGMMVGGQMQMHMMPYGPPGMFFGQYAMPGHGMMNMGMNPMMAQAAAFGGQPHHPHPHHPQQQHPSVIAAGGKPGQSQQQHAAYVPALPPRTAGIPLSLSCDDEQLSEYQMLVRKQLEIFEAQPEDVESNTQGRKKQVTLNQVGIRCRHCAGFPLRQRGRGAVYYPARLNGVYQASQNMASSHLCESCQCIPPPLKTELRTLRDRRDTASGGKQYWADGARAMGLYETEEGLRLRRPDGAPAANAQSPQSS